MIVSTWGFAAAANAAAVARMRSDGSLPDAGVRGATSTGVGEKVVRHIKAQRTDAIRGVQVGFLARDPHDAVGVFRLLPGFTHAVTDARGQTVVRLSPSLFRA